MSNKNRGIALFVNNGKFDNPEVNRDYYENDEELFQECFESLGFKVIIERDQTIKQIDVLLDKMRGDNYPGYESYLKDSDCFVAMFSSHGNKGNSFMCKDGHLKNLPALIKDKFEGDNNLVTKPKLFFIDACRGEDNLQHIELVS